jgi:hypothetical protein
VIRAEIIKRVETRARLCHRKLGLLTTPETGCLWQSRRIDAPSYLCTMAFVGISAPTGRAGLSQHQASVLLYADSQFDATPAW